LDGYLTRRDYPQHFRRIRFRDAETGKRLVFLTNQTTLPALTICALYNSRGQVELFFKWIKQHLLKRFYGTSENAVKTNRCVGLRAGRDHQEAAGPGGVALHIAAGPFGDNIRKGAASDCVLGRSLPV
jgi:hypothetical protein